MCAPPLGTMAGRLLMTRPNGPPFPPAQGVARAGIGARRRRSKSAIARLSAWVWRADACAARRALATGPCWALAVRRLRTRRVRPSTWSRTPFQNAVFKLSQNVLARARDRVHRAPSRRERRRGMLAAAAFVYDLRTGAAGA